MRTLTFESTTIEYPDELSFAFNPVILNFYGQEWQYIELIVKGAATQQSYSEKRSTFGSRCFFDISSYIRGLFDKISFSDVDYSETYFEDSGLGKNVTIEINFYLNDVVYNSTPITVETFSIWAAMRIGEQYNRIKKLTWFKNFPFTVGMYVPNDSTLYAVGDYTKKTEIRIGTEGVYNITMNNITAENILTFYLNPEPSASVWAAVFDYTFRPLFGTPAEVICTVNECTDGIYLRWINRHGFYCYWLFKEGDQTDTIADEGEFIRNNMMDYQLVNSYHGGTGRRQIKNRNTQIPICAPLVDQETFDFLTDLVSSPVVDMYYGELEDGVPRFVHVNIEEGNIVKTKKPLQDFIATIILPETRIQSL